jgi:Uma2 family endonuclease
LAARALVEKPKAALACDPNLLRSEERTLEGKRVQDPASKPLTYAEFVAYAQAHEGRFEYVDGQVVDMGIPTDAHQDLAFTLATMLSDHLKRVGCKVRIAGRLRTGKKEGSADRSPDLLVISDGKPRKLVVEILSQIRGDDLTSKLAEYQAMNEFEEYLVLDSTHRWVRVYRRNDGLFVFDADHIGGTVHLSSIDFSLDIDALYDDSGIA